MKQDILSQGQEKEWVPLRVYFKTTSDFFTQKDPQFYKSDLNTPDIQLQCEGYSLFNPDIVLERFLEFFFRLCNHIEEKKIRINSLKITINGFDIEKKQQFKQVRERQNEHISLLVYNIRRIAANIQSLSIHTSDLSNVFLSDFAKLFELIKGFCQNGNIHYQQFSLQCANWSFKERQPTYEEFRSVLRGVFKEQLEGQLIHNLKEKRIRLQFSGWWYSAADAKSFLGFLPSKEDLKKIEKAKHQYYQKGKQFVKETFSDIANKFNNEMFVMISNMIGIMSELEHIEIDMRNNHELLQLGKLKQKIASQAISDKKNISQKSLISMQRLTVLNEEKHLRVYFSY